jgi:hypothetical protein
VQKVTPLSAKHLEELHLAVDRARQQWVPQVHEPAQIVVALERVLLFLRQNGQPSPQARQVASLAFVLGEALVNSSTWAWASVSDDGSVNPSLVSADGQFALLVVDVVTLWVMSAHRLSLRELFEACRDGRPHPLFTALITTPP